MPRATVHPVVYISITHMYKERIIAEIALHGYTQQLSAMHVSLQHWLQEQVLNVLSLAV